MGATAVQAGHSMFDDSLDSGQVRVTDGHHDDILTGSQSPLCICMNFPQIRSVSCNRRAVSLNLASKLIDLFSSVFTSGSWAHANGYQNPIEWGITLILEYEMESEGQSAVHAFIDAFNKQDHEAHARSLNYPHIRLANGRYLRVDSAEEFTQISAKGEARLVEEGWHHTVVRSMEVIHAGPDKEHIALTIDRCRENGEVYNSFDTFWIATCQEGHWGIQFRSSFLR